MHRVQSNKEKQTARQIHEFCVDDFGARCLLTCSPASDQYQFQGDVNIKIWRQRYCKRELICYDF